MSLIKISFFIFFNVMFFLKSLDAQIKIEIANGHSLCRLEAPQLKQTTGNNKMASTFYYALINKNADSLKYVENSCLKLSKEINTIQNDYASFYWLSKYINADKKVIENELNEPLSSYIFNFFIENDFERLKKYLAASYHLNINTSDKDIISAIGDFAYLLRYNTPIRDNWERTSEILNCLPLKKGDKVIDVGCGFGYYTFKLSQLVGNEGKVFATEIKETYLDFIKKVIEKSGVTNISPQITSSDNIGVSDSVNAVFICELYHEIYGRTPDDKRSKLLNSMKQTLKVGGYLIIAENLNLNPNDLVKPYIDKRLIMAQLAYWGFSLVEDKNFPPYRYVLIFKHTNQIVKEQTLIAEEKNSDTSFFINVNSRQSVLRFSMPTIYDFTSRGKKAAALAYHFFETGISDSAVKAVALYDSILPLENLGGEYGAIKWLCKMKNTTDEKRNLILKDNNLSGYFYRKMTSNNNFLIKYYLINKYQLLDKNTSVITDSLVEKRFVFNKAEMIFLDNFIIDLNPERAFWDKSKAIIDKMNIQKGDIIADMGSSSGYYAYEFSKVVGNDGKVYSIDFMSKQRKEFENFVNEQNITNIEILKNEPDTYSLKEKVDIIFINSLYARMYGFIRINMENFIKNISENLKTNGKLIIVENGLVDDGQLPCRGLYLDKGLISSQMAFYDFELNSYEQLTPQRYMLTFVKKENNSH